MERREALKGIGVLSTLLIAPTMVFGDEVDEFVYLHYKPVNDDGGVLIYSNETYNKLLDKCGDDNAIDGYIRLLGDKSEFRYSFLTKDEFNSLDKRNCNLTYANFCSKGYKFLSIKEIKNKSKYISKKLIF